MGSVSESNEDEQKPKIAAAPRWTSAVLVIVAMVLISVAVASRSGENVERERDPLELVDEGELRTVVNAISEVIRAREGEPEGNAIRSLDAVHPNSPGALDLRDSCLTTYRNPHEAESLMRASQPLVPGDGSVSLELRTRLEHNLERIRTLVIEANESRDRCVTLYEAATRRLHLEPARRPAPATRTP
jgi:hypothetical protein